MKRRTSTTPVRIYTYGVLPPTANAHIVEQQFQRAHRYYNVLVTIERTRRTSIMRANDLLPNLEEWSTKIATLEVELEATRQAIRNRQAIRKKGTRDAELKTLKTAAKGVVVKLHDARESKSLARALLREDPQMIASYKSANDAAHEARLQARSECGCRHGTYLMIEDAVTAAAKAPSEGVWNMAPAFKEWRGEGRIGIQVQGGISVDDVMGCEDTFLRIVPPAPGTYDLPRHRRTIATRTTMQLRVGSNADRTPIWADFPVIMHRPLPPDGVVKWAWVKRIRIGLRYQYFFQVVVEAGSFKTPRRTDSDVVAIDIGWRNMGEDGIRVGYMCDDDGEAHPIMVPPRTTERYQKPRDLQSIRDKNFDEVRNTLVTWLKTIPHTWIHERTVALHQWRSQRRLAGVLYEWIKARIEGDVELFTLVTEWEKQDRHLLAWESNQRTRVQNHRKHEYKVFAAELTQKYQTIILENFDLRQFTKKKKEEDDGRPSDGTKQRDFGKIASPGELRECIKRAAAKYGATVVVVDPAMTTKACWACGSVEEWDAAQEVMHTCFSCGTTWDQDLNACKNMLKMHQGGIETLRAPQQRADQGERSHTSTT